jgi:uncharacterized protein (TIGR02271 family)
MFSTQEAQALIGATAYDQGGRKVGTLSALYLDKATGEPEWLTVKTGMFGMKETFVPLALARPRREGEVEFATDKNTVTGAPKIDPDGNLEESEEEQLFRHYGMDYSERRSPTGLPETGGLTVPQSAGADDAMTRSEERMHVGTATEETGRARLRKYVVTETVQQSVPVSHEEIRVEREPIAEANRDAAMGGPEISEAEHEVTLHEERPVVAKETVPVERVRLSKEQVTGEETVSGEVRKERIETETEGDTGTTR